MRKQKMIVIGCLCCAVLHLSAQTDGKWRLRECLDYALAHNIQLQQQEINYEQSEVDAKMAKHALFPSLSFSTSQNVQYRPFQESSSNIVNNGLAMSASDKVTENGSYSLNANWTVWNGGKNTKNLKLQELNSESARLNAEVTANSIQEQIAQLYVQILYSMEAVGVNEKLCETSQLQVERGKTLVEVGDLSVSDLAQLEAQYSTARYNAVNARTQVENYRLQLKQLLELEPEEQFDIVLPDVLETHALLPIPSEQAVYQSALTSRPEIKMSELSLQTADLNISIAKAGYMPTVGLSAGVNTSHLSGSSTSVGKQAKQNLSGAIGLTVSVPIFDNYNNKGSVSKAKLSYQNSSLELQQQKKQLYSTIELLRLDALSAQQRFVAASENVKNSQTSYDLIDEQFKLGLKNIVELLTSRDNLLSAEQEKLQSKYTTILNVQLLKFYSGEPIEL